MHSPAAEFRFRDDGKFNILAIGDVHERVCCNDDKTKDAMRLLKRASELRPDLAIFMGDIVSGFCEEENRMATKEELYEVLVKVSAPFTDKNIPFAVVFGNHDGQTGEGKPVLFELLKKIPHFVGSDESGAAGCGNCNVLIKSSDGKKDKFNIFLIDSGDSTLDGSGYAWVEDSQIEWYESVGNELKEKNGGNMVPALVFQHIPVCEEYDLLKETSILNPYRVKGQAEYRGKYYVKGKNCKGYLGEGPCVPAKNNGQFASWKKQGDVIAAFFGHDHLNDFVGEVDGITLGQMKCSGFHMYGDGLHQGVRMITLYENGDKKFDTKMIYYRDFFGTECRTIKGYDLLTDRWHTNFKVTLAVTGALAALTAAGTAIKFAKGRKKRKDKSR
ncbi:MAG: metallophosphoesterase [Clostridiales bacterium]|nr:metallophosphoesterase [Clostridiales bacterium]